MKQIKLFLVGLFLSVGISTNASAQISSGLQGPDVPSGPYSRMDVILAQVGHVVDADGNPLPFEEIQEIYIIRNPPRNITPRSLPPHVVRGLVDQLDADRNRGRFEELVDITCERLRIDIEQEPGTDNWIVEFGWLHSSPSGMLPEFLKGPNCRLYFNHRFNYDFTEWDHWSGAMVEHIF